MHAIFSNQIEILYAHLKEKLFSEGGFFKRRLVALPSKGMESYLLQQLTQDFGVAMGIEWCSHQELIYRLSKASLVPSRIELIFGIEALLEKEPPSALITYLGNPTSPRYFRRRRRVAEKLAKEFLMYGIYGIPENALPWERAFWHHLMEDPFYCNLNQHTLTPHFDPNTEVHLFGLSYLPAVHHRFLLRCAQKIPLTYYVLSPSCHFWSDLRTDRQKGNFASDGHPLLANWGSLSRRFLRELEGMQGMAEEAYAMAPIEDYLDSITESVHLFEKKGTLLDHLQADLLTMHERSFLKQLPKDDSISVCIVSDLFRSVEVARDKVLQLLDEKKANLSEIIVMAPSIAAYRSAIEALFGKEIPYRIEEEKPLCLDALFKVVEGIAEEYDYYQLLQLPGVAKKVELNDEELIEAREYFGNIYWREALQQRCASFLNREGPPFTQAELCGRLWRYLEQLEEITAPMRTQQPLPLKEWKTILERLWDHIGFEEECGFAKVLNRQTIAALFPWESIKKYWIAYLERKKIEAKPFDGIRFGTFASMRAVPAKVVVLLGLSEEQFPQKEGAFARAESAPLNCEYERYLFLEAILSAREQIIFIGSETKESGLSVPLIELLNYLERHYGMEGESVSAHILFKQTDNFYFPRYETRLIENMPSCPKEKKLTFDELFIFKEMRSLSKQKEKMTIEEMTIQELARICRDPVQVFMKEQLGIVFKESKPHSLCQQLSLSALDRFLFKQEYSDQKSADQIRLLLMQKKQVPHGRFKEAMCEELGALIEEHSLFLENYGVQIEELRTLHLGGPGGEAAVEIENVRITGELKGVYREKLFLDRKDDARGVLLSWPAILLFSLIQKREGRQAEIIFLPSQRTYLPRQEDVEEALRRLVRHALYVRSQMVPLLSDWVEAWEKEEIEKKIKQVGNDFFYNQTLIWAASVRKLPAITKEQAAQWKAYAREVFGGFELLYAKEL